MFVYYHWTKETYNEDWGDKTKKKKKKDEDKIMCAYGVQDKMIVHTSCLVMVDKTQ
jgi:hypothetical protein